MRLAVAATLIAIGSPALAERASVRLDVDASVCDAAALRARVIELLGSDPFTDEAATTARFGIGQTGGQGPLRGTLVIRDAAGTEHGRRVFEAADCRELGESAALVITMVLASWPLDERPAPTAGDDRHSEVQPPVAAVVDSTARPAVPFSVLAGLSGTADGDATRGALHLGIGARGAAASAGLELQLVAPEQRPVGGGRLVVSEGAVEIVPCVHHRALAACGTLAIGWTRGRGEELLEARAATTPFAAVGARVAWEHPLADRLALRAHLAARFPVTRSRFQVDDMTVWSTRIVEGWLAVSFVARIP